MHHQATLDTKSAIDGLWVLLVNDGASEEAHIPMMARAGNEQTYLLGFKNMHKAKTFIDASELDGAEPRMVVKSNRGEFLNIARERGVVGVLVDYDPSTQEYSTASELY